MGWLAGQGLEAVELLGVASAASVLMCISLHTSSYTTKPGNLHKNCNRAAKGDLRYRFGEENHHPLQEGHENPPRNFSLPPLWKRIYNPWAQLSI